MKFWVVLGKVKLPSSQLIKKVSWEPSPKGWFKLNIDGAASRNPRKPTIVVVIRYGNGFWMIGYAKGLGVSLNFIVELCALRDGLLLARNRGLPLLIEIDLGYFSYFVYC